jgi:hypothetical protein
MNFSYNKNKLKILSIIGIGTVSCLYLKRKIKKKSIFTINNDKIIEIIKKASKDEELKNNFKEFFYDFAYNFISNEKNVLLFKNYTKILLEDNEFRNKFIIFRNNIINKEENNLVKLFEKEEFKNYFKKLFNDSLMNFFNNNENKIMIKNYIQELISNNSNNLKWGFFKRFFSNFFIEQKNNINNTQNNFQKDKKEQLLKIKQFMERKI